MKKETQPLAAPSLVFIELSHTQESDLNPRKEFNDEALHELTESIRELGLIQPITVRPISVAAPHARGKKKAAAGYEVICGARRFRACLAAGLKTIPASVRELTDEQAMELMVTENLQRKDVNPAEESDAFQFMIKSMKYSVEDVAARIGKPTSYVVRRLQLQRLIPELYSDLKKDALGIGHAELISRVPLEAQRNWMSSVFHNQYHGAGTVSDLRTWLKRNVEHKLADGGFDIEDAVLIDDAGACTSCLRNSAFATNLFPDQANEAICHDSICYKAKQAATFTRKVIEAIEDPEVYLLDGSFSAGDPVVKKVRDEGHTVLKYMEDFEAHRKPTLYRIANWTPEQEEEAKERHDRAMGEYHRMIPTWKQGFYLAGNDRGEYVYITLKHTRRAAAADGDDATEISIKISELNAKITRGAQLDVEKIHKRAIDALKDDAWIFGYRAESKLTQTEKDGFRLLAYDALSYELKKKANKELGLNAEYPSDSDIYRALLAADQDLWHYILRNALLSKYAVGNLYGFNPMVVQGLAEDYLPVKFEEIRQEQEDIAEKRDAKLKLQIEELEGVKS